jgi:hypothetical protein
MTNIVLPTLQTQYILDFSSASRSRTLGFAKHWDCLDVASVWCSLVMHKPSKFCHRDRRKGIFDGYFNTYSVVEDMQSHSVCCNGWNSNYNFFQALLNPLFKFAPLYIGTQFINREKRVYTKSIVFNGLCHVLSHTPALNKGHKWILKPSDIWSRFKLSKVRPTINILLDPDTGKPERPFQILVLWLVCWSIVIRAIETIIPPSLYYTSSNALDSKPNPLPNQTSCQTKYLVKPN